MTSLSADAAAWVAGLGAWTFVVAPLVMTAVALLPVPAEPPAMMNGLLFGVWLGSLVPWSGAMAGAWISFLWTTAVGIAPGAVVFTSSGAGLGYVWGHSALAGWVAILVVGAVGVILYYRRHG